MGGRAVPLVDSNMLPERYIAKLCGIGFLGKNNMLITQRYGSYVFLGEIITDLALGNSEILQSQCRGCNICLKACPTGAIRGEKNSNKCMSYITQKNILKMSGFLNFEETYLDVIFVRIYVHIIGKSYFPIYRNLDHLNLWKM